MGKKITGKETREKICERFGDKETMELKNLEII